MAYKESAYTIVIAIVQWPKRTIFVLKLTLVVEIQALLSRRGRHCSNALSDFRWQYQAHEDSDHTAVIAVVNWRLHAKTHRAG